MNFKVGDKVLVTKPEWLLTGETVEFMGQSPTQRGFIMIKHKIQRSGYSDRYFRVKESDIRKLTKLEQALK